MYWIHGVTLARRDGGYTCRYCGVALIPPSNEPDFILPDPNAVHGTVDHLIPLARGGRNNTGNLGLACRTCNVDKGNLTEIEYRRLLKQRKNIIVW
jgi:5-methylcytosine-specific restriction endonuclease McrA